MSEKAETIILKGIPASSGIAFGEARVVYSGEQSIVERNIEKDDIDREIDRLDRAVEQTTQDLQKYQRKAGQKLAGPVARIFDSQLLIASDVDFLDKVKAEIAESLKSAEYIYSMLVEKSMVPLRISKDPYMRQMVYDIEAVANKIIDNLSGQHGKTIFPAIRDCVFVGKRFNPGDLLTLYEQDARAVITTGGSPNSHMALVARSLLIPAVVGVNQAHLKINSGDRVIVNGDKGIITVNPSDAEWNKLRGKESDFRLLPITKLKKLPLFPLKTKDKQEVSVAVNITLPGPLDKTLAGRHIGVGLYRTEFLYLQHGEFPTEESQFNVYDGVAEQYYPQHVVIRTYDLGSDKFLDENENNRESNPALGWRGIRATLDMPKIFRDQLRAILRASTRGNVKILLPMISDLSELRRAITIIRKCKAELKRSRIKFDENIKTGIMIEVPSAAVVADSLADRVDFFSVGSNDLTQYTLAADRDNRKLIKLFNQMHPAVLRLIKFTVEAAERHNIPVTVCGEISGDILAIPLLVGMGVSELSMNPAKLHNAASTIPKFSMPEVRRLADEVLRMKSSREIEGRLLEFNMGLD